MKLLALDILAFALVGILPGCATTQKVTDPVIATVKDCADATTHAIAAGILDDVSSVLVCEAGNAASLPACVIAQLGAIAKANGWPAVDCVLAEIREKSSENVKASEDTVENLRARRATAAIAWRASP